MIAALYHCRVLQHRWRKLVEAMRRPWINPVIRSAVYFYLAAGIALLINYVIGMDSVLRYEADKRFAVLFLFGVFASTFGLLAFASWDAFQRPISWRKWILFCVFSSLGLVAFQAAPRFAGGGGT